MEKQNITLAAKKIALLGPKRALTHTTCLQTVLSHIFTTNLRMYKCWRRGEGWAAFIKRGLLSRASDRSPLGFALT